MMSIAEVSQPNTELKNPAAAGRSGVYSSSQHSAPGSVTTSRPVMRWGSQTPKGTPARSARIAIRPSSATSMGCDSTEPWACSTALAVASASGVRK